MAKRRRSQGPSVCPCGSGVGFDACCGPVLAGQPAPTAEALMRSRYTAHVIGDDAHLHRSWHPDHRPPGPHVDPAIRWRDLTVVAVEGGGSLDAGGTVEFVARHAGGAVHERSRFVRLDGRWVYVDGVTLH